MKPGARFELWQISRTPDFRNSMEKLGQWLGQTEAIAFAIGPLRF